MIILHSFPGRQGFFAVPSEHEPGACLLNPKWRDFFADHTENSPDMQDFSAEA
jgi:hypothetical protein